MSYRDEVMALRGQGQWMHCCDVDDAAKVAEKSDVEIAGLRSSLAGAYAKLAMAESKAARLTDENKKYAKALTEHQGSIDWREWMLVPATEASFVPKQKHDQIAARADARIAELVAALRALLDAPPDFASHVAAIENARAALVKESPDE